MASDNITKYTLDWISGSKSFDIDNLVDQAVQDIYVEKNYLELRKHYLHSIIATVCNANGYYSVGAGKFVKLIDATLDDLKAIDENFTKNIKGMVKTLRKVKDQEQIAGQMGFKVSEGALGEITVEPSMAEQLEELIKIAQ